jgi:hypothetical protein
MTHGTKSVMARRGRSKSASPAGRLVSKAQKTCSTCKAFTTTDDNGGHCQRHPPTVFTTHQGSIGYWPPVRKDSWCLEHVRK